MIHVRAWKGDELTDEGPTLQLTLSGTKELEKFNWILNRALNIAAPEDPSIQDWLSLCDKLEAFLYKTKQ
jgi:hypothetical protein